METLRKKEITEVHFQHKLWENQLDFYKDELYIFQERLEEIASKNTGKEVHVSIEQFQNKFFIQNKELSNLRHLIKANEDKVISAGKVHIRRIDYEASAVYNSIRDQMVQFEKLYVELKEEFIDFLRKWM